MAYFTLYNEHREQTDIKLFIVFILVIFKEFNDHIQF